MGRAVAVVVIVAFVVIAVLAVWNLHAQGYTDTEWSFGRPKGRDCVLIKGTQWLCKPKPTPTALGT